jgi:glycosyltransferase involved in cell wall biosynthesis
MGVSALIIAKDEADRIRPCLNSVTWADEIIAVVDDATTDDTAAICRHAGARVLELPWMGYSRQRQRALESVTQEWVLMIDADERATAELRDEIRGIIGNGSPHDAYYVNRRTLLWNREIRCRYPDEQTRFFRRDKGYFPERAVHEGWTPLTPGTSVGHLTHDLVHDSYRSFLHLVNKFDEYAELAAQDILNSGRPVSIGLALRRSCFTFFKYHILKGGLFDGPPGLVYNLAHAYYVFLKYARAYEMTVQQRSPGHPLAVTPPVEPTREVSTPSSTT